MKAIRLHGQEDLRLEDLDEPICRPGLVKVRVAYCGICGTDLHEYIGGPDMCATNPHPITGEKMPLILGHELSGIVEEVGFGVEGFKAGDRVCVEPIIWDGGCGPCSEGLHNLCDKGGFIGLSGWGGGYSSHVVIPPISLYHLPDNVSLGVGALIEPLAVGWHAVKSSPVQPNSTALVLGGGPIGLCVIQALVAHGIAQIIVSDVAQRRKAFAAQFGAATVVDPTVEDLVQRCRDLTAGRGVHVVFDCAGVQPALGPAIASLRTRGVLVNVALWKHDARLQPADFMTKEKTYQGVITYQRGDFAEVLRAIGRGSIMPEGMITKKIRLEDTLEEGFKTLINEKEKHVKILVESGGTPELYDRDVSK